MFREIPKLTTLLGCDRHVSCRFGHMQQEGLRGKLALNLEDIEVGTFSMFRIRTARINPAPLASHRGTRYLMNKNTALMLQYSS